MSSKAQRSTSEIKTSKRLKRRQKKKDPYLKVPGVKKLTLSDNAQKLLGCIAGEDITIETPWKYVETDLIHDNINLQESSEFLPIQAELAKYKAKQIYVGYVADDSKDEDDFYICTIEESISIIDELTEKLKKEQDERLHNAIFKTIKEWSSMGSEQEVDECIYKNNRPLIEMEVESGYPVSPARKGFDMNRVEDRKDGYMELKFNPEERFFCVSKRRVHAYVQVAPQFTTRHVQTVCTYPINASTQYKYEIGDTAPLLAKCAKPFKEYVLEHYDHITDILQVNGRLNLYSEDYLSLIKNDAKFISAAAVEEVKEYMSFTDVELCKEKMIADIIFHPMWTGVAAAAYNQIAPFIYYSGPITDDIVAKTLIGSNLVLIWSCLDSLKPKLILNSPREVIKLAFCKFNENLLIGGLKNGQIIIWDIQNKLQQVEETRILSPFQVRNQATLRSLLSWMKIIHDIAIVPPAAISDIKNSHKGPVTGINWVTPFYEFSKLGKLEEIPSDAEQPYSMQFMTTAEDGTLLIWDLMKTPQIDADGFKPRKLKRLKKKPSALMSFSSPFAVHNLNLRPMYKIIIPRKSKNSLAISSCYDDHCPMQYEEENPVKSKKQAAFNERVIYKPIMDKNLYKNIEPEIRLGSMEGDFLHVRWKGQSFNSGELINSETAIVETRGKHHDGPLYTAQQNPLFDVTLTVGGRIFALWNRNLPNRPILWRKASQMYMSGEWDVSQPYLFTNKLQNGDVETWSLAYDSKDPTFSLTFSSGYLTASAFHSLKQKRNIYGAADKLGSLRLFYMPEDSVPGTVEKKQEKFQNFIEREVRRKNLFLEWQTNWNKVETALRLAREKLDLDQKEKQDEKSVAVTVEDKEAAPKENEPKKERPGKKGLPEVSFIEKTIMKRRREEEARIKETMVAKKQLDTKELEKRRKPLQKLEEEDERKKKKQKQRLKEGEQIFMDTVSSLFPDVMKEKPPPPPDPHASMWVTKSLSVNTYDKFLTVRENMNEFIENNPYNYVFNWSNILETGRIRRENMSDPSGNREAVWNIRTHRASTVSDAPLELEVIFDEFKSVKSIQSDKTLPSVKSEKSMKSVTSVTEG